MNLAEDRIGKIRDLTRFWSWTYAVFLRTRLDKGLSLILAGVGLAAVCVGKAHAAGQWQGLAPLFVAERISWPLHGWAVSLSMNCCRIATARSSPATAQTALRTVATT